MRQVLLIIESHNTPEKPCLQGVILCSKFIPIHVHERLFEQGTMIYLSLLYHDFERLLLNTIFLKELV